MSKQPVPYTFRCENETDWSAIITLEADNGILLMMLQQAYNKLGARELNAKLQLDNIEEFKVPEDRKSQLFPVLKNGVPLVSSGIRPIMSIIMANVLKRGYIKILSWDITDCIFKKRDSKGWTISIHTWGLYEKTSQF